jgi:hypothetical protein
MADSSKDVPQVSSSEQEQKQLREAQRAMQKELGGGPSIRIPNLDTLYQDPPEQPLELEQAPSRQRMEMER